jgi:hypothetical protein
MITICIKAKVFQFCLIFCCHVEGIALTSYGEDRQAAVTGYTSVDTAASTVAEYKFPLLVAYAVKLVI